MEALVAGNEDRAGNVMNLVLVAGGIAADEHAVRFLNPKSLSAAAPRTA